MRTGQSSFIPSHLSTPTPSLCGDGGLGEEGLHHHHREFSLLPQRTKHWSCQTLDNFGDIQCLLYVQGPLTWFEKIRRFKVAFRSTQDHICSKASKLFLNGSW